MKLGVSTSVYLHKRIKKAINKIGKLNFKYIELWGEPPHLWFDEPNYKKLAEIKKFLNEKELIPTYHGPAHDIDITSVNPGIRKESLKQNKEAINIASFLGSDIIVIHMGSYYPGDKEGTENGKDRLYKSLDYLLPYAEKNNITIALENYPVGENAIFNKPEEVLNILNDFSTEYLKLTLDIGHANLTNISPLHYIKTLGDEIVHLHLSDNFGKEDQHLVPGEGEINYLEIIKILKEISFDKVGIFEIWAPKNTDQALMNSKDYIKSLV